MALFERSAAIGVSERREFCAQVALLLRFMLARPQITSIVASNAPLPEAGCPQ